MKHRFFFCVSWSYLILLAAAALSAAWLAPYSAQDENRAYSYHPPSRIRFVDESGRFHLRPFVYVTRPRFDVSYRRYYEEDRSKKYFLNFSGAKALTVEAPARLYVFGADSRGRDLFSRILYGARVSLSVGILGALIASGVGLLVGGLAGYYGGKIDEILMRISEFFIMIPAFYFLLALRSALPPGLGSAQVYALIVSVLSLIGWGAVARVIRGMVFSICQNDFIRAAKALGRSDLDILCRHVFPHTFSYWMIVVSISVPSYVLSESALSVLGLGIQEPDVSWGSLLNEALSVVHLELHPWILFPGLFLFLTALCFNRLGDGWRELWGRS